MNPTEINRNRPNWSLVLVLALDLFVKASCIPHYSCTFEAGNNVRNQLNVGGDSQTHESGTLPNGNLENDSSSLSQGSALGHVGQTNSVAAVPIVPQSLVGMPTYLPGQVAALHPFLMHQQAVPPSLALLMFLNLIPPIFTRYLQYHLFNSGRTNRLHQKVCRCHPMTKISRHKVDQIWLEWKILMTMKCLLMGNVAIQSTLIMSVKSQNLML